MRYRALFRLLLIGSSNIFVRGFSYVFQHTFVICFIYRRGRAKCQKTITRVQPDLYYSHCGPSASARFLVLTDANLRPTQFRNCRANSSTFVETRSIYRTKTWRTERKLRRFAILRAGVFSFREVFGFKLLLTRGGTIDNNNTVAPATTTTTTHQFLFVRRQFHVGRQLEYW